jgi:hypothetical protein
MFKAIWEVFIEDFNIIINDAGGMFILDSEPIGPREPIGEVFDVEIPYDLTSKVFGLINEKKKVEDKVEKMFNNVETIKNLKASDRFLDE